MSFPRYKYLLTYRYAEIIYDLTFLFCQKWVSEIKDRRTRDQMEQAARSGKQNIVEGVGQTETSKSGEIKLLGVAKASLDELLADYEDFLRKNNLPIWPKVDQRVLRFRKIGYDLSSLGNLSGLGNLRHKPILPIEPVDAANFLLTLCHMETYLLDRQILAAKDRLVKEGGVNENLLKKRLEYRKMKLNSPYSSNG